MEHRRETGRSEPRSIEYELNRIEARNGDGEINCEEGEGLSIDINLALSRKIESPRLKSRVEVATKLNVASSGLRACGSPTNNGNRGESSN